MKRGIAFLVLWLVVTALLSGVFIPAIPPGGVEWPYYFLVVCVPVGALLYARFASKACVAISYGLIAGAWFALPIFYDARALIAGATTIESVAIKVTLFAFFASLACSGAFVVGRRLFRRDDRHTA